MGTCQHMDLFLVRHGVTDWNKEKRYLGHSDRGILKSELTKLADLKKQLMQISFDYVFTSDLRRCRETLAYLNIPTLISIDARLQEINFGDWEGKTYEELKYDQVYQKWLDDWENQSIPNGETARKFKNRINLFFNDLYQQLLENNLMTKQKVLVMTHGGVIRYFVSKLVSSQSFWGLEVKHGHGICLKLIFQKGEWVCESLSEVPFQEKEK